MILAAADLGTIGKGKVLHHLTELGESGRARCGMAGPVGSREYEVDVRAIRVRGRSVCVTCTALALRQTRGDEADA